MQVLQEHKFGCEAHPNCGFCQEVGAYPSCAILCTFENKFLLIRISFQTCYEYRYSVGISYHVHACSGSIHDLPMLVLHLRLERLSLVGSEFRIQKLGFLEIHNESLQYERTLLVHSWFNLFQDYQITLA